MGMNAEEVEVMQHEGTEEQKLGEEELSLAVDIVSCWPVKCRCGNIPGLTPAPGLTFKSFKSVS